ncbi:MAG: hypothetical protein JWQ79_3549 [Mucilaginibacter sp.]|nr:hypothetical protein [Mucilaginibacter sp.]
MELDEFKTHWKGIHDNELKQQKYTTEKLDHIIMNTTNTLGELRKKSIYWSKFGKISGALLIVVYLIDMFLFYFLPNQGNKFSESLLYGAIISVYAMVTIGTTEWQQQIFTMYDNENLKATLKKTLSAFKRFYIVCNLISFVLFPVFYYAAIKFFFLSWPIKPSANFILLICGLLTIVSFLGSRLTYKMKTGKRIKTLEMNLRELEE